MPATQLSVPMTHARRGPRSTARVQLHQDYMQTVLCAHNMPRASTPARVTGVTRRTDSWRQEHAISNPDSGHVKPMPAIRHMAFLSIIHKDRRTARAGRQECAALSKVLV
jgi:hypothetical protein